MNEKIMKEAAKAAQEMQNRLTIRLKDKDVKYAFEFGSTALASLIAGFVDAIFKNEHPDKKIEFMKELVHLSTLVLHSKNLIRDNNKGEKH